MRLIQMAGLAALLLMPATAWASAAGMPVEPGIWEFVATVPNPLQASPIRSAYKTCVRERFITPERVMAKLKGCRIWDVVIRDSAAKWKMRCDTEAGPMSGGGSLRSETVSVSGSFQLFLSIGSVDVPANGTFKGRRVGPCR